MAEFKYKAKDPSGRLRIGKINAVNKSQARTALVRMRLRPLLLQAVKLDGPAGASDGSMPLLGNLIYRDKDGKLQISLGDQQPTSKDLIVFTKQFATMINSGVTMIKALSILASQQRIRSFGLTLEKIQHSVENGAKLSDAMEAFPKIFDTLYISMVRAGEASGKLDIILTKLVTYIEKAAKIKSQVKSAMMYPAIVVVVAIIVITLLLVLVVPTFAKQYEQSDKQLPELTAIVISISNFLTNNWLELTIGISLSGIGFVQFVKTERGRIWFDEWILKSPGLGILLKKIAVGRFCSTMATMLTAGVPLLEALTICASTSGNKTIESFVTNIRAKIEQGSKISEPLGEGKLFPPMVVSMVAVGEQTGALDEMLSKVSDFYEDEVDLAVKTLLSMIEPIMIVVIGSIAGFIVIAMYLPVFDMGNLVG